MQTYVCYMEYWARGCFLQVEALHTWSQKAAYVDLNSCIMFFVVVVVIFY